MSTHVMQEAAAVRDQVASLRGYLNNLPDAFTGQAATQFDNTFDNWKQCADQVISSLEELGQFLGHAATTIEDTDTQVASQLSSATG